jgi:hypothetical protein
MYRLERNATWPVQRTAQASDAPCDDEFTFAHPSAPRALNEPGARLVRVRGTGRARHPWTSDC